MKKSVLYLMLAATTLFSLMSVMEINAQVTIGKDTIPHPGAVLELRTNKGLLLPRVSLGDSKDFQLSSSEKDKAAGMIVYNTNHGMTDGKGEGVYVWNGSEWTILAMTGRNILVSKLTISAAGGATTVPVNKTLQFTSAVEPDNATNPAIKWSVSGVGSIDDNGLFTAVDQEGDVTIIAESVDGSNLSDRKTITVVAAITPDFHKENGYGVYTMEENGEWVSWMVENSREGTATYDTFTNQKTGARGYYYTWNQAAGACISGYRLPTPDEIKNLLNRVKSVSERDNVYWAGESSKAGLYYGNSFGQWDIAGYWWTNEKDKAAYNFMDFNQTGVSTQNDILASVRCVKKEPK